MKVRPATLFDQKALIRLIAEFRVTLACFKGKTPEINLEAAEDELKP